MIDVGIYDANCSVCFFKINIIPKVELDFNSKSFMTYRQYDLRKL